MEQPVGVDPPMGNVALCNAYASSDEDTEQGVAVVEDWIPARGRWRLSHQEEREFLGLESRSVSHRWILRWRSSTEASLSAPSA